MQMHCAAFIENRCRSCTLLEGGYSESIKKKEADFFRLFAPISIGYYEPPVILKNPKESRNKLKLSTKEIDGQIFFGVYDELQNFSSLQDCPLHLNGMNGLLTPLRVLLEQSNVKAYDLMTRTGEVKGVIITKSQSTEQVMIRCVLRSKESLDRIKKNLPDFMSSHTSVKVFSINIQPIHIAGVEGNEEIILSSDKYILHQFSKVQLALGVKSFFQVSSEIAEQLYGRVQSFLSQQKVSCFLDLYCGVGAFSIYASPFINKGYGVEISEEAIEFAQLNQQLNAATNLSFSASQVHTIWDQLDQNYEVILLNPPRGGVDTHSLKKIMCLSPEYIIYSSCNAKTLARDFAILKDHYQILSAQIFDMFPWTTHYETLLIMKKLV